MTQRSTDELLAEFKAVLAETIRKYDDPVLQFQAECGIADWSMNDSEEGMIIDGVNRLDIVRVLAHAVIILSHEEDRYYEQMAEEAEEALQAIEDDEESSDEEKEIACRVVEEGVRSQLSGFSHGVALVQGWAAAAVAANESETVNWDDMLEGTA